MIYFKRNTKSTDRSLVFVSFVVRMPNCTLMMLSEDRKT